MKYTHKHMEASLMPLTITVIFLNH
jgi:hypothetical protein